MPTWLVFSLPARAERFCSDSFRCVARRRARMKPMATIAMANAPPTPTLTPTPTRMVLSCDDFAAAAMAEADDAEMAAGEGG